MHAWGLVNKNTGELAGLIAVAWRTREEARFSKKMRGMGHNKASNDLKVVRLEMWVDNRTKEETACGRS